MPIDSVIEENITKLLNERNDKKKNMMHYLAQVQQIYGRMN